MGRDCLSVITLISVPARTLVSPIVGKSLPLRLSTTGGCGAAPAPPALGAPAPGAPAPGAPAPGPPAPPAAGPAPGAPAPAPGAPAGAPPGGPKLKPRGPPPPPTFMRP